MEFGYGRGGVQKVLRRHGIARRSLSDALTGRVFSDDHRRRLSDSHADVSGVNNPMYGRPPGHGKRVYVDHLQCCVRSTWESTVALALLAADIQHDYEPHRLAVGDRTYLPDFLLPDHGLYLEVKGWMGFRSASILADVALHRPDVNLLIIGPEEYQPIADDPAAIIPLIDGHHGGASPP